MNFISPPPKLIRISEDCRYLVLKCVDKEGKTTGYELLRYELNAYGFSTAEEAMRHAEFIQSSTSPPERVSSTLELAGYRPSPPSE